MEYVYSKRSYRPERKVYTTSEASSNAVNEAISTYGVPLAIVALGSYLAGSRSYGTRTFGNIFKGYGVTKGLNALMSGQPVRGTRRWGSDRVVGKSVRGKARGRLRKFSKFRGRNFGRRSKSAYRYRRGRRRRRYY